MGKNWSLSSQIQLLRVADGAELMLVRTITNSLPASLQLGTDVLLPCIQCHVIGGCAQVRT